MREHKNKRKNFNKIRKRRKIRRIIYLMFLVFLLLYVPIVIIVSGGAAAELAIIGNGSISDSISARGIVLKQEIVFVMPFEGVYSIEAEEGERVPAGYMIASVVDGAFAEKFKEMERLGSEILKRKKNGDISTGIFTRDLHQMEEKIKESIARIAEIAVTGELQDISEIQYDLEQYSAYRDKIITGSSSSDAYTGDLTVQYNILKQSLADKMEEIYTDEPGYISYNLDGYEGELTLELIPEYTVGELKESIASFNRKNLKEDNAGAFVKIATGNFYTLAFVLDSDEADKLKTRGRAVIHIENMGIEFSVNDISFGDETDGKVCVYFKTNKKLGELASVRYIEAKIIYYEYKGLIVPVKSLYNLEAYPIRSVEIAKVKDNWIHFIEVEVIIEKGKYAIIRSIEDDLNLYDYYAVNPKKVEEGQVVK